MAPLLDKECRTADIAATPTKVTTSPKAAAIGLEPLFSGQAGSWHYEPFALQGIFQFIALHQNHHPHAIILNGGETTLAALHRHLNDAQIIQPFKNGYLLSYPLIIQPGASLKLGGDHLYLDAGSGSFIVNRGRLEVLQSRIGISGQKRQLEGRNVQYRPFIISWAGSTTRIEASDIADLGFPGNLTNGLTLARHATQGSNTPDAILLLRQTHLQNMSTALQLHSAQAELGSVNVVDTHHDAILSRDSSMHASAMVLDGAHHGSTLRLAGKGCIEIDTSRFKGSQRPVIEADEFQGYFRLTQSVVSDSAASGLRAVHSAPTTRGSSGARLVIRNNQFVANARDGIELHNAGPLLIEGNDIQGNGRYAVSLTTDASTANQARAGQESGVDSVSTPYQILSANRISVDGIAGLRLDGPYHLLLGPQTFHLQPTQSQAFTGNAAPIQGDLFKASMKQSQWIELISPAPTASADGM